MIPALSVTRKTRSPKTLFANGEKGVFFDCQDMSSMFQDAAGTTAVTAVEQPVGRINDKSGNGFNATQSTSASRPVLSARVNVLEKTDDLANVAYWGVNGIASRSTSSLFTTFTENTSNSTHVVHKNSALTVPLGTAVTISCSFKAGTRRYLQFQWDNNSGAVGAVIDTQAWTISAFGHTAASITDMGSGEYLVSVTGSISSGTTTVNAVIYGLANSTISNVTYTGTSATFIAGKIDLRVANDGVGLPAYQRVNTSTDYDDSASWPRYLKFDGTDDSLATASIDFSGGDAMTVFAGVRKLSDAARGTVVELTATAASNNGSFHLTAPNAASATYAFESKGTSLTDAVASSSVAAPITNVLTAPSDISADSNVLRVNGTQADSDTGDQGSGNFSNAALYIGRRGGSSLPLNGRLYGLIVRGAATTDQDIVSTEQWLRNKSKAY